jgi:putative oxidoreductase
VQRLFSTFPSDWPGCGLLILRLTAAAPLVVGSASFLGNFTHHLAGRVIALIALATGGLLILGLCTPLSALLQIGLELCIMCFDHSVLFDHVVLAAIGASLLMLGPGAWSLDAKLFGRRRIEFPDD